MTLLDIVRNRTLLSTGMSKDELLALMNADDSVLHDPYLYDGMSELVNQLHEFKLRQQQNRNYLLVIDTDYDTDGVMSAAVLSAALDVIGINYRIYIPSMHDGYGLSPKAVQDMLSMYEVNNFKVKMILTADNGTNAVKGVEHANNNGIDVLVTDHHLGGNNYANAKVIVNPNKSMPNGDVEPYPFKGNAGATVAWKTMLAYVMRYDKDKYQLIYDLIVFAGISNVADVMPILDENHYMVKKSVDEIKRLVHIRSLYNENPLDDADPYMDIKATPYIHYNAVFHGLYDLITILQASKDDKRKSQNKKPIPMKTDEELISWYLSPMINAPRRIHATSKEAMLALMSPNIQQRHDNINAMISMNEQKSEMRNAITEKINWEQLQSNDANVLFVNAQHGISGLIAGQVAEKTGKAAMVFAMPTTSDIKIYSDHQFDERYNHDTMVISASARSSNAQPLNRIMDRIKEIRPDIITGGGGHAAAAGYSILYKYLDVFRLLFNNVAKQVADEVQAEYRSMVASGIVKPIIQNVVELSFYEGNDTDEYAHYNVRENKDSFMADMMYIHSFQEDLKPFGKDFNAQTKFKIQIDPVMLLEPEYHLNLDFWKTLKFNIYGVDVITFNIELADLIKERIKMNNPALIEVSAKLEMNSFRGNITPQLQLEP